MEVPHRRRLKIDLAELAYAFENSDWETDYFLDLETGKIIMVKESTFRDLENIMDEHEETEEEDEIDLPDVLDEMDLEDWERRVILQADRVKEGFDDRYLSVPLSDSHEAFQDMEAFISEPQNDKLKNRLSQAIQGRHPFRRFVDTLVSYPVEREHWFAFKQERLQKRILEWLASEGIEIL
jgi:hypothetical protein